MAWSLDDASGELVAGLLDTEPHALARALLASARLRASDSFVART